MCLHTWHSNANPFAYLRPARKEKKNELISYIYCISSQRGAFTWPLPTQKELIMFVIKFSAVLVYNGVNYVPFYIQKNLIGTLLSHDAWHLFVLSSIL